MDKAAIIGTARGYGFWSDATAPSEILHHNKSLYRDFSHIISLNTPVAFEQLSISNVDMIIIDLLSLDGAGDWVESHFQEYLASAALIIIHGLNSPHVSDNLRNLALTHANGIQHLKFSEGEGLLVIMAQAQTDIALHQLAEHLGNAPELTPIGRILNRLGTQHAQDWALHTAMENLDSQKILAAKLVREFAQTQSQSEQELLANTCRITALEEDRKTRFEEIAKITRRLFDLNRSFTARDARLEQLEAENTTLVQELATNAAAYAARTAVLEHRIATLEAEVAANRTRAQNAEVGIDNCMRESSVTADLFRAECAALREDRDFLRSEVARFYESKSWRYTASFRALRRLIIG
jgi:hypothetical protein